MFSYTTSLCQFPFLETNASLSFGRHFLSCFTAPLFSSVKKIEEVNHGFNKFILWIVSSVIRQKGESQNGCFKKTKHAKFSKKRTFLTPWYARNVRFSENLACFVFLKHPFWDSPFSLITDDMRKPRGKCLLMILFFFLVLL